MEHRNIDMLLRFLEVSFLLGAILLANTGVWQANAYADSIEVQGVPFFDTSLGTLTAVEVTIDLLPFELPSTFTVRPPIIGGEPVPEVEHTHVVTNFTIFFIGGEYVFPPMTTETEFYNPHSIHTHFLDPDPVTFRYEGADLEYFFDNSSEFIIDLPPESKFVPSRVGISTDVVLDHQHASSTFTKFVSHSTESTTTFEFIPIPEPSSRVLALIAFGLVGTRMLFVKVAR